VLGWAPRVRAVFLLVLVGSVTAWAQAASASPAPAPSARLFVTGGAALRQLSQPYEGAGVTIAGFAPTALHASGAYFFTRWFGLDVEARGEVFHAGNTADPAQPKVPLGGFSASALPTFRWSPLAWLDAEAQLGWGVAGRPMISLAGTAPEGRLVVGTGPTAGFALSFEPRDWLGAQLFARAVVPLTQSVSFGGDFGLQLRLGALTVGDTRWGVGVTWETALLHAGSGDNTLWHVEHRFGLGVAMLHREPPPPTPVLEAPAATTATLTGRVQVAGTLAPIPGAVVEARGRAATTDADGRFSLEALPPGAATATVTARGFKVVSREVSLAVGAPATADFSLDAPTGPGRIVGTVKGPDGKPLAGVLVRVDGGAEVKSDADGDFLLPKAGPGPVTVTAALNGYEKGDEVVQVPPEAQARVDFTLKPTGVRAKATLKGVVSGSDSAVPKATLRVVELKLTLKARADGRYEVEVPGGRYTLTIQAPGYVTQSKTLEVADGDQAIFHVELEKVR